MSKVRIIYGSVTGNTASIAFMLEDYLKSQGHEVDCKNAGKVKAEGLGDGYDCVLLGTSIWGIDEILLESEFSEYENSFPEMGLESKKCAAFASGDVSYPLYCGGVDFIEEKYKEVNAKIINHGLRVEGHAEENEDEILAWAKEVANAL